MLKFFSELGKQKSSQPQAEVISQRPYYGIEIADSYKCLEMYNSLRSDEEPDDNLRNAIEHKTSYTCIADVENVNVFESFTPVDVAEKFQSKARLIGAIKELPKNIQFDGDKVKYGVESFYTKSREYVYIQIRLPQGSSYDDVLRMLRSDLEKAIKECNTSTDTK